MSVSVGAGGVIDQLWVALGIKPDSTGFRQIKQEVDEAKSSLLSVGTAVKAFVAGFAIKEVADIGATFENNRNSIAGFLSEMGLSSDFTAGLQDASDIVNKITIDAAKWPGEAEDYIKVFKAGLPFLKDAVPGGRNGIVDFLDNFTAVVKSKNPDIDIGTIARETRELFEGRAMLRNNVFMSLLPSLKLLDGQAGLTAQKFNAMTQPQRVQLLQALFTRMKPQIDAAANSFDAMWGAAVSALKQMTRVATAPLFKGMKQGLDAINSALYDANGKLTPFGQGIVDAISTGVKYLTQFMAMGGHLLLWFAHSKAGALTFKAALSLLGAALTGLAVEKTIGSFASLLKVMTNLKSLLTGGLFLAIGLIAEDLYRFATGGNSVTGLLAKKFPDAFMGAMAAVQQLSDALGVIGQVLSVVVSNSNLLLTALILLGAAFAPEAALGAGMFWIGQKAAELIVQFTKLIGLAHALGFVAEEPDSLQNFKSNYDRNASADDDEPNFLRKIPSTIRRPVVTAPTPTWHAWSPADSAAPGAFAGATSSQVNNNQKIDINIQSTEPRAAGKEAAREIVRTANSGVKF
jgi:hypothetical protein